MKKSKRKNYSKDFIEKCKQMNKNGVKYNDIAKMYSLPPGTVHSWIFPRNKRNISDVVNTQNDKTENDRYDLYVKNIENILFDILKNLEQLNNKWS